MAQWRVLENATRASLSLFGEKDIRVRVSVGTFSLAFMLSLAQVLSAIAVAEQPRIPDTAVQDQDGRRLSFYSDLVKGHTVAIDFIFTTCATVCPMLTANFRQVQKELGDNAHDVRLISISVDPAIDTPARLKHFAEQYQAGPGWSFVTGDKTEIDRLLSALGVPVQNKLEHSPAVLIGNDVSGHWQRVSGLVSSSVILHTVEEAAASQPESPAAAQAAAYFPNVELLTQDGVKVHFFDDVLRGKTVLINFMFTSCTAVCSPMTANLARVQKCLGERVGRDIVMASITVDPEADTPSVLKSYAAKFGAKPGWYFLTGSKANVDEVLSKLGGYVKDKNQHSSVLIVGNVAHGGWQKMLGIGNPDAIANMALDLAR
jgi:cytochrome oxidase Cu insertion factor (SCO1/SenC/PrrC family)